MLETLHEINQKRIDKFERKGYFDNFPLAWDAFLLHMHRVNDEKIGINRNRGLIDNVRSGRKARILKSRKKQQKELRDAYIKNNEWQMAQANKRRGITAKVKTVKNMSPRASRGLSHGKTRKIHTPPWAETQKHQAIIAIAYRWARMMTKKTGRAYSVDHVIPLRGDIVSGLHVYENLKVSPTTANIEKGNTFCV